VATKSKHGTLTANTVTTVTITFSGSKSGFRIQHRSTSSTAPLWWSWGTAAADVATPTTAGADDTYCLPSGSPPDVFTDQVGQTLVVKLISSDALDYSVETW
jgi:hypothetical protein